MLLIGGAASLLRDFDTHGVLHLIRKRFLLAKTNTRQKYQLADLVGHSLTLGDGFWPVEINSMKGIKTQRWDVTPPAGNHRHILAFLLLDRLAHSVGNLLANRIGHLIMCEQFTISTISYHRANLVGKGGALGLWFLPEGESITFPKSQ